MNCWSMWHHLSILSYSLYKKANVFSTKNGGFSAYLWPHYIISYTIKKYEDMPGGASPLPFFIISYLTRASMALIISTRMMAS